MLLLWLSQLICGENITCLFLVLASRCRSQDAIQKAATKLLMQSSAPFGPERTHQSVLIPLGLSFVVCFTPLFSLGLLSCCERAKQQKPPELTKRCSGKKGEAKRWRKEERSENIYSVEVTVKVLSRTKRNISLPPRNANRPSPFLPVLCSNRIFFGNDGVVAIFVDPCQSFHTVSSDLGRFCALG